MSSKFKPLYHQVFVLCGATSEAGIEVTHRAVEQGAKVFMIDIDEDKLQKIQDEMRHKGYDTAYAVANLSEVEQVQFAADQCIATFGMIDTWINIPGTMDANVKKTFEINFWSLVNGCQIAVPYLSQHGGVLINVGSAVRGEKLSEERSVEALKEAVRGYTDALRKELKEKHPKIKATLINVSTPNEIGKAIIKNAQRPRKIIETQKSWLDRIYQNKSPQKGLIASGIGGMALMGGLTFFFLKKLRLL